MVEKFGPDLGRPWVETLKGSVHSNMKELRITNGKEEWRIAFAFDPNRQAILLYGGNKSGKTEIRFYKSLIKIADARFDAHVKDIGEGKKP